MHYYILRLLAIDLFWTFHLRNTFYINCHWVIVNIIYIHVKGKVHPFKFYSFTHHDMLKKQKTNIYSLKLGKYDKYCFYLLTFACICFCTVLIRSHYKILIRLTSGLWLGLCNTLIAFSFQPFCWTSDMDSV